MINREWSISVLRYFRLFALSGSLSILVVGALSAVALERDRKRQDRVALSRSAASFRDVETTTSIIPRDETGASSHKRGRLDRQRLETLSRQFGSSRR